MTAVAQAISASGAHSRTYTLASNQLLLAWSRGLWSTHLHIGGTSMVPIYGEPGCALTMSTSLMTIRLHPPAADLAADYPAHQNNFRPVGLKSNVS